MEVHRDGTLENGTCGKPLRAAYADLTVELSEETKPFAHMLRYELLRSGDVIDSYFEPRKNAYALPPEIGESVLGRGKDRIFIPCDPNGPSTSGSLSPGNHRIQMRALLPDDHELVTNEVVVNLSCPDGQDGQDTPDVAPSRLSDAGPDEVPANGRSAITNPRSAADDAGCSLLQGSGPGAGTVLVLLSALPLRRPRKKVRA